MLLSFLLKKHIFPFMLFHLPCLFLSLHIVCSVENQSVKGVVRVPVLVQRTSLLALFCTLVELLMTASAMDVSQGLYRCDLFRLQH